MKKDGWMTGLFLIILSSLAIVTRIYYINNLMAEVGINEEIYNAAKVSAATSGLSSVFAEGFNIQTLYICNLYAAFLIFGNFTVAGVYLNVLYQVLTVLLVYIMVKNVLNRIIGFVVGIVVSIFPTYIGELSEVTVRNMQIFVVVLFCTIVVGVIRIFLRRNQGKKADTNEVAAIQKTVTETVQESQPVQDASMKEIRLDDLEGNKIHYIENPLPVPKRREHKQMDFAFELSSENDDYDLKDMTGKDFYDIE